MTTSLPGPGVALVHGAALTGIDAQIIQVQATIGTGAPGFAIIGVPSDSTREIRDRVPGRGPLPCQVNMSGS